MKISNRYGPQFDPADGTIGKIQLVKRWYSWSCPRQGRNTYATKEEAAARLPEEYEAPELWWCYPTHFDPVRKVHTESIEEIIAAYERGEL